MRPRHLIPVPERVLGMKFRIFRDFGARELLIAGAAFLAVAFILFLPGELSHKIIVAAIVAGIATSWIKLRVRGYTPEQWMTIVVNFLMRPRVYIHSNAYTISQPVATPPPQSQPSQPKTKPKKAPKEAVQRVPKPAVAPQVAVKPVRWDWSREGVWALVSMIVVVSIIFAAIAMSNDWMFLWTQAVQQFLSSSSP